MNDVTVCFALILLILVFAPSAGGEAGEQVAQQESRGALLYRIHCQNCHGASGKGDGPLARLLTVNPADLTAIASKNNGNFPADKVHQAIDGRAEVRAHGMREMPVWGLTLQQSDRDSAQDNEVQARIDDLVAHLESMQDSER